MHGLWDIAHRLFGSSLFGLPMTEIPLGYGMFCLTFDLTVAGYLMMSDTAWDDPGKLTFFSGEMDRDSASSSALS